MKQEDFQRLNGTDPHVAGAADLVRHMPRTLLYGRTAMGRIWHVYLDSDGTIHRLAYDAHERPRVRFYALGEKGDCTESSHYVRHKLLYPERCDYEFCRVLLGLNVQLNFAAYPESTLGVPHNRYAPFVAPTLQVLLAQDGLFSTCEVELRDAGYVLGAAYNPDETASMSGARSPALPAAWALAA